MEQIQFETVNIFKFLISKGLDKALLKEDNKKIKLSITLDNNTTTCEVYTKKNINIKTNNKIFFSYPKSKFKGFIDNLFKLEIENFSSNETTPIIRFIKENITLKEYEELEKGYGIIIPKISEKDIRKGKKIKDLSYINKSLDLVKFNIKPFCYKGFNNYDYIKILESK